MSAESWPPQLKTWVATCLGQMTESNREEASQEMKQVIAEAYQSGTLWTTDWVGMQLKSLLPKPLPTVNLKRKMPDGSPISKKAKKAASKQTTKTISDPFNDQVALNKRAERFQREHEIEKSKSTKSGNSSSIKASPHHLFNKRNISRNDSPYDPDYKPEPDPNVWEWDTYTIVGTSGEVFKEYLRLTTEPKPDTIRPLAVLRQTLQQLKEKWKAKTPYHWICSQFKSLRQDLTVQRIKNDFTVQVYEIHARMALESNDMVEYYQCQAALMNLYDLGIPGKVEEFTAYRILMLLHGRNRGDLNLYVGQLTPNLKMNGAVRHALSVSRAILTGDYHQLFKLYLDAPNMGAYIMDHFIDRERAKALMVITKAYKTFPLAYLRQELAFDDYEATHKFLVDHSVTYFVDPYKHDDEKDLDCKFANPKIKEIFEAKYRRIQIRGAI